MSVGRCGYLSRALRIRRIRLPIVRASSASTVAPPFPAAGLAPLPWGRGLGAAGLGGRPLGEGALTRLLAGCPDPVGCRGGGGRSPRRRPVSCWASPAASQIPTESWAAVVTSRTTICWSPPSAGLRLSRRVVVPSGWAVSLRVPWVWGCGPGAGTVQWSRLMLVVTGTSAAGSWVMVGPFVRSRPRRCAVSRCPPCLIAPCRPGTRSGAGPDVTSGDRPGRAAESRPSGGTVIGGVRVWSNGRGGCCCAETPAGWATPAAIAHPGGAGRGDGRTRGGIAQRASPLAGQIRSAEPHGGGRG